MTPSHAELRIDPQPLHNQILKEYSLLWEMGRKPYEFDDDGFDTEYFYRREIFMKRKDGIPFFKHVVPPNRLTERMQVMIQRHNVIATFANIATDMFMMRNLSYEEYCSLARACVHDITLNIVGEKDSKRHRKELYEQDYGATEFYGVFSKAVDAALAGDYRFAMPYFEGGSPVQIRALGKVGEEAMANFHQLREDFIIRKNAGIIEQAGFDFAAKGTYVEMRENREILAKHGVTPDMSTFVGQFTLDASLATGA